MPVNNLDHVYRNLPAFMRRDDEETLVLRRFLTPYGETLDDWDQTFDSFFEMIAPATATEEFIDWWLWALFDWSWFPRWYQIADKRSLYSHMGHHLARRGTARGIESWLFDFAVHARVWTRPLVWGEFVWGEPAFGVNTPLKLVVEIICIDDRVNHDMAYWGESVWGEGVWNTPEQTLTEAEIESLLRFVQPNAQDVYSTWTVHPSA